MTATLTPTPPRSAPAPTPRGGPARRAIRRWAWRLLRREWRQQITVLALLIVAVGATTVGLGLIVNVEGSSLGQAGKASSRIDMAVSGPIAPIIAAARQQLGTIEAIEHQNVPLAGSVNPIDVRAQDPHGIYGSPMLHLVSGQYPSGAGSVALTRGVASELHLATGGTWTVSGQLLRVVGIVENPNDLQDQFALVAPGELVAPDALTLLTDTGGNALDNFQAAGAQIQGIMEIGGTQAQQKQHRALAVLLLSTIGMTFVGLLSVAGFTVMAQRRMRALGMIGAIGATDRQVRRVMLANGAAVGTVGAGVGVLSGLAVWFAFRPAFESLVGHRIDALSIPWWAVIAAAVLAVLTAVAAAWWPARTIARMPIVAALSGRPAPPQPAHRFALTGAALATTGFVLLALDHGGAHVFLIIGGVLATTCGMLLLAPLGIRALAALAGRAPIATRLALRDLARYQARSGAALAAASLAVGIAATIAVTASAQQASDSSGSTGNLPSNQMIVWLDGSPYDGGGPSTAVTAIGPSGATGDTPSPQAIADAQNVANSIAQSVHARHDVELDMAVDVTDPAPPGGGPNFAPLVRQISGSGGKSGFKVASFPYLITPAVLQLYGIPASSVGAGTDVLTSRTDLGGTLLGTGEDTTFAPVRVQQNRQLPTYSSDPNTLVSQKAVQANGLVAQPAGWLVESPHALTKAQINDARDRAAAAGIVIETRNQPNHSLQQLRQYSTIAGLLVALGVLAMTVGLIRSETSGDLRTLAATGASSSTRRTLTAATAGALALLGGILGTATAYLALIAWNWHHVHHLDHPPYAELTVLVVGLPVAAGIGGWLFGRTPSTISRRALE